jgi:hypothetical protein
MESAMCNLIITIDSVAYTEEAWRMLPEINPCEGLWEDFIFAAEERVLTSLQEYILFWNSYLDYKKKRRRRRIQE